VAEQQVPQALLHHTAAPWSPQNALASGRQSKLWRPAAHSSAAG